MDKSSKVVNLALIGTVVGSAFLVSAAFTVKGCQDEQREADNDWGPSENVASTGTTHSTGHGGFFFLPRLFSGSGGGGGGMTATPSARGGFGSSGSVGSAST